MSNKKIHIHDWLDNKAALDNGQPLLIDTLFVNKVVETIAARHIEQVLSVSHLNEPENVAHLDGHIVCEANNQSLEYYSKIIGITIPNGYTIFNVVS